MDPARSGGGTTDAAVAAVVVAAAAADDYCPPPSNGEEIDWIACLLIDYGMSHAEAVFQTVQYLVVAFECMFAQGLSCHLLPTGPDVMREMCNWYGGG